MLGFINLQISLLTIAVPNILYGLGMALAMIPLITLSCKNIPAEKMSNASGLQNFIKTIGGAVGTSLVATFISRFSQTHQNMLIHFLSETNNIFAQRIEIYTSQFAQMTDISTASQMAHTVIYNQLLQQSRLWAFIDSFRIFAVAGIFILILIFAMRSGNKNRIGE